MRILLVSHRYPPDGIGGVERYTQELATELVKAGEPVSIVARRPGPGPDPPKMAPERLPDGASLYRLVGGESRVDRFLACDERLERLFEMALIEAAPDVVHINHLLGLSPRFPSLARRHGAAVVLSLHDFYLACPLAFLRKTSGEPCEGPDGGRECARACFAYEGATAQLRWGLRTAYFRRLLTLADRVISPSRYVAEYFERFGAPPARVRVIPNGVGIAPVDSPNGTVAGRQADGTLHLAFLGTIAPQKGIHLILDALRVANLRGVRLTIHGPSPIPEYARQLRERAETIAGLTLQCPGPYEPAELQALLHTVDCVIVPSLVPESFSMTAREAFVWSVPVIATRLGSLPEAVIDGVNGFTFDPARPAELAAILQCLAEDEGLRSRLRRGARSSPVLTAVEHMQAVRAVYREALDERAQGDVTADATAAELGFLHSALVDLGCRATD